MRSIFQRYEQLPGGQEELPPASTSKYSSRKERKQIQRSFLLSGLFILAVFLILGLAFSRHPEWYDPVGEFDRTGTKSKSTQDTLPSIDWSWTEEGQSWYGSTSPNLGSDAWLARYPGFVHGPAPRQSWLDRYKAAKAAGLIPELPKAELIGGLANYPEDLAMDDALCSYRRASCTAASDIVRGPAATWAINFDDGPLPPSAVLYKALDEWNEKATHFWVGNNVKNNVELAVQAAERGDHLAVHTWSHPHLTTYTNEQILGELGWTMQIIYDVSTHLPRYYRPPFGDVDNRVRALAQHVFNMTAVMWNYDSFDWSLNQTWASGDFVDPPYDWLTTEMSTKRLTDRMAENDPVNGEGVIVLEHELSYESIQAFTESHSHIASNHWRCGTVPDLLDLPWYH